ncbi:hypothetical protein Mapa_002163 [Marchantia paleacea]|nr:hypothetical protein Mapa_002163 [Marchantia paleacea]
MPCPSFPVSIWEDEYGECGGCESSHVKVPVSSAGDLRASSELQMVAAVKLLLQGIGEDVEREGILKTPLRVAKAFQSFFSGYELTPEGIIGGALFTEAGTDGGTGGGSGGMVVVRKIDAFALCDTCFLPFRIRCHVTYIPFGQRVVGLSKLPRVVNMLSRRLQNPQKLANELVQALYDTFVPLGVAAAVESWHLEWPGACDRIGGSVGNYAEERLGFGWVPTTVYAARGKLENVQSCFWDEFLAIVGVDGVEIRKPTLGTTNAFPSKDKSCPFFAYSGKAEGRASVGAIALAIESLVRAEGEHLNREELHLTASRYVNWLLSATQGSNQKLLNGTVIEIDLKGSVNGSVVHSNGNSCSHSNGILYGVTHGSANGHSNGTGNCYSNGINYGVNNGAVNGYSNGTNHGASNGAVVGYSNGVNHGVSNGAVNGHSNGSNLGVSNGAANGVQSIAEQPNGSLFLGMTVAPGLDEHADGLVSLELDLPFSSLCEHHLLPFFGVAHLGYVGGRERLERSLVLKIVQMFSRRLQVQERLTRQIAEAIASLADFKWIMVVVEANHMCIMSRGVEKLGSNTATVASIGQFANDGAMRARFLKQISRTATKRTCF